MNKILFLSFLLLSSVYHAQLRINEASNANFNTLQNNNLPLGDWFEVYNAGTQTENLENYFVSDDINQLQKWQLKANQLLANEFKIYLANGEGKGTSVNHFETAVFASDTWKYSVPTAPINNWQNTGFNDASWSSGAQSIGFGDNDDITPVAANISSVYQRIQFNVSDPTKIIFGQLDVDYDDGFVVYLNGVEVARNGVTGNPATWDELASINHEALIYQGQNPEVFVIDSLLLANTLVVGTNTLAIEIHNTALASSDLTSISFLTFGFTDNQVYYSGTQHPYFQGGGGSVYENTNFTFKAKGETVYLSNLNGTIIDSLQIPDLDIDHSFGRKNDGTNTIGIFNQPTPGATNNASNLFQAYLPSPVLTTPSGKYATSVNVQATNPDATNGAIRFTVNGQTPTATSPLFAGSVIFTTTVVTLRNIPTNADYLPSKKIMGTYLIDDPTTLAIVSITTDDVNLYGPTGIFDNSTTDWKRTCTFDYIGKDGQWKFSHNASIKPDGGAGGSRTNAQHSVTIEPANSILGDGKTIDYALIPEKPYVQKFDAFYLRNGSNYWNQYPQRDATIMRITKGSNANYQGYTPVTVFLNGAYFGVYELREKANERYFEQNYGNDVDSLDLCSVSYFYGPDIIRPVEGSDTSYYNMVNFITNYSPFSSDFYSKSNQLLDLNNFADYMAIENWYTNYDWLYNNMKFARTRSFDNRWRFFLQDLEIGPGNWGDPTSNLFDHINGNGQSYVLMYNSLQQNTQFRNYFINRFADLMNTKFRSSSYTPIVNEMYDELLPELPRHFQQWTGNPILGMIDYANQKNSFLNALDNRNVNVRSQIVTHFSLVKEVDVTLDVFPAGAGYIKISTIVPETLPWTGVYFDGVPVEITAISNPGFEFQSWETNATLTTNELLIASVNPNIASNDLFKALFVGTPETSKISVSEIHFHPDSVQNGGDWIELYNDSEKEIDITSWKLKSKQQWESFEFSANTTIPAKGFLVVATKKNAFQTYYPTVSNMVGADFFAWSNSQDSIILENPFGQRIIEFAYSDAWTHARIADGFGRSLERRSLQSINNDESAWMSGCLEGSPGVAFSPCSENLMITEISYNANFMKAWFEIKNTGNQSINLNDLFVKQGENGALVNLGNNTLAPNEYFTFYGDNAFLNFHPTISNAEQLSNLDFDARSALRIYSATGKIVASFRWNDLGPWEVINLTENKTLNLIEEVASIAPNHPEHWKLSCEGGSPSKNRIVCSTPAIGSLFSIFPNPVVNEIFITVNNSLNLPSKIEIIDMTGKIVYRNSNATSPLDEYTISIPVNDFLQGMYFLRLAQGNERDQVRFVKMD